MLPLLATVLILGIYVAATVLMLRIVAVVAERVAGRRDTDP